MLADLTSATPARRGLARSGLLAALVGDGRRLTPATLEVVPALIGLIADPATPDRAALLSLIAELVTGDTCWFLHDGFHVDHQRRADSAARSRHVGYAAGGPHPARLLTRLADDGRPTEPGSLGRAIAEAAAAGMPTYLAAAVDPDPAVRAAVPFVCGFLTSEPAARVAAVTLQRLLDDPAPVVRASAALGLSHATRFVPAWWEGAFHELDRRWSRGCAPLVRRCLALALVRFDQPARTRAVRAYLTDQLAAGVPRVAPSRFPWCRVDSAPFVMCTSYLGTDPAERDLLRGPACAALPSIDDPHDAADLALWIARLWTPASHAPLARAAITPDEAAALEAIAAAPRAWHWGDLGEELRDRGLPSDRAALRRWLRDRAPAAG
jgi:HEAT repeat protein